MATADAQRKADSRAAARDLVIPDVADPDRRATAEADDRLWLTTYCPDVFYNPFTPHQEQIIDDCGNTLKFGTQKCTAAPRGDGKSSIVKYLALKYALCRQVRFPLIIAATHSKGKKVLGSLKRRLAAKADTALSEDYPLECHVARYVNPWPSRARNVTANGQRSIHVEWGGDSMIIPTWEAEEPLGPILMSLGISSDDLQGCNVYDQRPDFVMLDDLDSRDSLAAEDGLIAGKIEEIIDKTVAGMGGQSRRLGQFMLCTITSRNAAAYKYSDPQQKPSWSGKRIPAIQSWPNRMDLWDDYISLRQDGQTTLDDSGQPRDVFGRKAHQHYIENREVMDAAAVLSNPYNFESETLPDGTQKHLSALQKCFDYIADNGMESFQTEHQNDPPENEQITDSGLTDRRVQTQLSGYGERMVPPGCTVITQGIDIRKTELHYVVRAWRPDCTGFTIEYGVNTIHGPGVNSDEGLDTAIANAIMARMAEVQEEPFCADDGECKNVNLTLIDAGWRTDAVYFATEQFGQDVRPAMGFGKSGGTVQANFTDLTQRTKDKRPGDGWFLSRKRGKPWLVCMDTDRWKTFEHDRWLSRPDQPGAMFLWGDPTAEAGRLSFDAKGHLKYAKQITAECEVEDVVKKKLVKRWKSTSNSNHWLDASYMSNVAANMLGIRLMRPKRQIQQQEAAPATERRRMSFRRRGT